MGIYLKPNSGTTKHLTIWAHDVPEHSGPGGTGRYVPLCGRDRGARWEAVPAHYADLWYYSICRLCLNKLSELSDVVELNTFLRKNDIEPPEQAR